MARDYLGFLARPEFGQDVASLREKSRSTRLGLLWMGWMPWSGEVGPRGLNVMAPIATCNQFRSSNLVMSSGEHVTNRLRRHVVSDLGFVFGYVLENWSYPA